MSDTGYAGKVNVYVCPDGHRTITIDRDDGVTPMMLRCRQRAIKSLCSCDLMARSSFYQVDQTLIPEFEFYKPGPDEKIDRMLRDHVRQGGLLFRKIGEVKDVECAPARAEPKIGRNSPCFCGSGKKYKHCHDKLS